MKLIQLELHNFKSHKHTKITFDSGIYCINGVVDNNIRRSNNAGKSSIFHAINFALWKRVTEKQDSGFILDDCILKGESESWVELEFETYSKVKIRRSLERMKGKTTSSLSLYVWNGGYEEFKSRSSEEVQTFLEQLLGFDQFVWFKTFMRSQGVTSEFLTATKDNRIDMLSNIFGYQEFLDRIQDMIKDKLLFYNQKVMEYEKEFAVRSESLLSKDERSRLKDEYDRIHARIDQIDIELVNAIDDVLYEDRQIQFEKKKKEFNSLQNQIKIAHEMNLQKKKKLIESLEGIQDRRKLKLGDIKSRIDAHLQLITEYPDDISEKDFNEYHEKLSNKLKKLNDHYQVLSNNQSILNRDLDNLSKDYTVCPILNEECDRITKDSLHPRLNQIRMKLDTVLNESNESVASITEVETKIKLNKNELDEFNRNVVRLNQINEWRLTVAELENPSDDERVVSEQLMNQDMPLDSMNLRLIELQSEIQVLENELSGVDGISKNVLLSEKVKLEKSVIPIEIQFENHSKAKQICKEIENRKDKLSKLQILYANSKNTFGKKGFIQYHIEKSLQLLELKINEYMNFFDDGRLQLSLDNKITVYDRMANVEVPVYVLSGGQQNLITFCYNLALIYIKFYENPAAKLICLDEPFEILDESNVESGITALSHLFGELSLSNCLLITHKPVHHKGLKFITIYNSNGIASMVNDE